MKVLVICDDYWHPGEVVVRGMSTLDKEKYELDFVMDAKDILTQEMLREYPVIVNAKGNSVTAANQTTWFQPGVTEVTPKEFQEYVEEGGGFISIHSGNSFKDTTCKEYTDFVGNSFVGHPRRCPVTIRPMGTHPITEGVAAFTERDEHYQLENFAPDCEMILESVSETGGTQIAGYVREMGKGRLCALTPGHILAMWQNPNFQRLLANAIDWCAQK